MVVLGWLYCGFDSLFVIGSRFLQVLGGCLFGFGLFVWVKKLGQKRTPDLLRDRVLYEKVAATYFPAFDRSIIGAEGLSFSVRDGKRWAPSL